MTLIRFLVPAAGLTRFLAITLDLAVATRGAGAQGGDAAADGLAALVAGPAGGRGGPRILKALEGVEHDVGKACSMETETEHHDYYKTKKGIHALICGRSIFREEEQTAKTADEDYYVVEHRLIRLNPRIFAFA